MFSGLVRSRPQVVPAHRAWPWSPGIRRYAAALHHSPSDCRSSFVSMTLLARTSSSRAPRNIVTWRACSFLTIFAPRINRTCGISSKRPFLRCTYVPPWLDVRCPYSFFTRSLARPRSYLARRKASEYRVVSQTSVTAPPSPPTTAATTTTPSLSPSRIRGFSASPSTSRLPYTEAVYRTLFLTVFVTP